KVGVNSVWAPRRAVKKRQPNIISIFFLCIQNAPFINVWVYPNIFQKPATSGNPFEDSLQFKSFLQALAP
ncbi:MAG: hypothetical protein CVV50_03035, partial [Spirochaetae bacterium HGW-Spirochaetae-6]